MKPQPANFRVKHWMVLSLPKCKAVFLNHLAMAATAVMFAVSGSAELRAEPQAQVAIVSETAGKDLLAPCLKDALRVVEIAGGAELQRTNAALFVSFKDVDPNPEVSEFSLGCRQNRNGLVVFAAHHKGNPQSTYWTSIAKLHAAAFGAEPKTIAAQLQSCAALARKSKSREVQCTAGKVLIEINYVPFGPSSPNTLWSVYASEQ